MLNYSFVGSLAYTQAQFVKDITFTNVHWLLGFTWGKSRSMSVAFCYILTPQNITKIKFFITKIWVKRYFTVHISFTFFQLFEIKLLMFNYQIYFLQFNNYLLFNWKLINILLFKLQIKQTENNVLYWINYLPFEDCYMHLLKISLLQSQVFPLCRKCFCTVVLWGVGSLFYITFIVI